MKNWPYSAVPLTTSTQNERTGVAVLTHWSQPGPLGTGGGRPWKYGCSGHLALVPLTSTAGP